MQSFDLVCRFDERRNALANLIKITRDGKEDIWTEHFKTILLILLETLVDPDVSKILILCFVVFSFIVNALKLV